MEKEDIINTLGFGEDYGQKALYNCECVRKTPIGRAGKRSDKQSGEQEC
jgi:hypothetical protein